MTEILRTEPDTKAAPPAEAAMSSPGATPPRRRLWRWLVPLALLGIAVAALILFTELSWRDLKQAMLRLNTPTLLTLMAVLPLAGFSIAAVYLMAGAKFGLVMGGVVVAGITAFHLLASYAIARGALRNALEGWLKKRRRFIPHIPDDDDVAATLLTLFLPGIPYAVRNYFLPIAGIPLRIYFWLCLPIHVAHAYTTLYLVALATDPGGSRLAVLIAIYVVKIVVCAEVIRRIRKRHRHLRAPGWP